jgi:putative transposase
VRLLVKVPPKLSISGLMGALKGRTAIRLFSAFPSPSDLPYGWLAMGITIWIESAV